mgnify:CR=1 FL=1
MVGGAHDIKGQAIHAYVVLNASETVSDLLERDLAQWVRRKIGPIATSERVRIVPGLPKTRSGKIMRRILRKISEGHADDLGDTSTLADPAILDILLETPATGSEPGGGARTGPP